ncbi:MAG: glycosyltransferase family 39 protein [Spirochaetes bacterium]|nr:glycosyltransferase family 39 protein [Spirochaetota bacterium]
MLRLTKMVDDFRTKIAPYDLFDKLSGMLLSVLVLLSLCTFWHYGISYDEPIQRIYGKSVFNYYVSGLQDRSYEKMDGNMRYYGAAYDATVETVINLIPMDRYMSRKLIGALCGIFGIFGVCKLARHIGGPKAGFFAALLLAITPPYYGHMFINSKDIPFAVAYLWTVYFTIRMLYELPKLNRNTIIKLGVSMGLALGIRIGGLLLLCYIPLMLALWYGASFAGLIPGLHERLKTFFRLGLAAAASWGIAWVVMLVFWPWAQQSPFLRPIESIGMFSSYPWIGPVLFQGRTLMSSNLPSSYIPVHLFYKLPEIFHVLALASVGVLLHIISRAIRNTGNRVVLPVISLVVIVTAIVLPVGYLIVRHAIVYDEIRHIIFVYPLLAVLAGLTAAYIADHMPQFLVKIGAVAAILILLMPLITMIMLHPYQYAYYNTFAGGMKKAATQFETDYWGLSYKETVEKFKRYMNVSGETNAKSVFIHGPIESAKYYLRNRYPIADEGHADYLFVHYRLDGFNKFSGRDIVTVGRCGATFAVVRDRMDSNRTYPGRTDKAR